MRVPLLLLTTWLVLANVSIDAADESPNILWITAEDMSPTLGSYGDRFATTPHLDQFAKESVRYTRAFATAPVCSPSRSSLITGCYAPSLGTMNMRSALPIPKAMTGFPAVLREELGYYTSNNVKTDYNTANWETIIEASWNESSGTAHWRNREGGNQPFFSIFNLMTSHQSRTMVWPYARFETEVQSRLAESEMHDPEKVPLPPYYPDTPVIRRELARYYDCVSVMDREVGDLLSQLEEDGLAEDTIVFFYSDHGSGMPRHKRALLDSGMHVPLMIRFPEKWQHLAPANPGETVDQLVSFVDFGPTVLSLAGAEIPEAMQGRPFLGDESAAPRDYVFGHRDRVDEVLDMARSVRSEQFLYIRNFHPHRGYNQPTAWPDLGAIRHEIYRLTDEQDMTPAQWHFAGPRRPAEELYDCDVDPLNLVNLAGDPAHQGTLETMRQLQREHAIEFGDAGLMPESELWNLVEEKGMTPLELAQQGALGIEELGAAAADVGYAEEATFLDRLQDERASIRYWGVMGLVAAESLSKEAHESLATALSDSSAAVRIEAANALARTGDLKAALPVLVAEFQNENLSAVLHAMRTVEMLGASAASLRPDVEKLLQRVNKIHPPDTPPTVVTPGDPDLAMFTRMSALAFLDATADSAQEEEGVAWQDLFDGHSLMGWEARAEGEVTVVDNEIRIMSVGKNLWLVHKGSFGDFELQVEALMPEAGYNSGIGFRCAGKGKPKGYQCEVANEKSGMIYAIGSGWVWPKGDADKAKFREMAKDSFRVGEWNHFRIRCEGERIRIWVNDTLTADVRDAQFSEGAIALQHHGKGDVHRFRSVQIREW